MDTRKPRHDRSVGDALGLSVSAPSGLDRQLAYCGPWRHGHVDGERRDSAADEAMAQTPDSHIRHFTRDPEGTCAQQAMVDSSQQVTAETKQLQHDAVHRQETVRVRGGCKRLTSRMRRPCAFAVLGG